MSTPSEIPVVSPVTAAEPDASTPDGSPWRGFVRRFLGLLLGSLLAIAAMNLLVNPMGLYPIHLLPPVTWNMRAIKPELLRQAEPKPQVLILGSSRSMQIAPAVVQRLTGLPAFNAAVESAMAEDDYAMLRYAVERAGLRPKLVIVGVDAEAFHNRLPIEEQALEADAFRGFLPGGGFSAWKKFYKLFVVQQARLSLRSLRVQLTGTFPHRLRFDPDGYLHYTDYEQERASGHYDAETKVQRNLAQYVARTASYTAVSPERRRYLEDLLRYCNQRGIKVVLWVTPLGPRLLETLGPRGYAEREREVLAMLQELGAKYGAAVYDFSSVEKFGGDPNGFWDGAHMTEANNALVVRRMLGRADAVQ